MKPEIAKYRGHRFKLIKRENKRLFIKQYKYKEPNNKPIWINESEVTYHYE